MLPAPIRGRLQAATELHAVVQRRRSFALAGDHLEVVLSPTGRALVFDRAGNLVSASMFPLPPAAACRQGATA